MFLVASRVFAQGAERQPLLELRPPRWGGDLRNPNPKVTVEPAAAGEPRHPARGALDPDPLGALAEEEATPWRGVSLWGGRCFPVLRS